MVPEGAALRERNNMQVNQGCAFSPGAAFVFALPSALAGGEPSAVTDGCWLSAGARAKIKARVGELAKRNS
jgi:hypothetical protein